MMERNGQRKSNGIQQVVTITDADVQELVRSNLVAAAQLEAIALRRILAERNEEIRMLKEKVPSGDH